MSKKVHFTGRVMQGLFVMIAGLIFIMVVGRPLLIMQFNTKDISEVGKSKVNWFTHVETDIDYSLGHAVKVIKKSDGKQFESYYLNVVTDFDSKGNLDPDKTFVYLSKSDPYMLQGIADDTADYLKYKMSDMYNKPANYHVKGTMSFIGISEKKKIVEYLTSDLGFSQTEAEEMVGTYMLVNEAGNDGKAGVYIGLAIMGIGLVWMTIALISSRK